MGVRGEWVLNDHLFMEGLRCPLRIRMMRLANDASFRRDDFRQRNKLYLRDAVALRFHQVRKTPDDTVEAEQKTMEWLDEDDDRAICGAVVSHGKAVTRIPVLLKGDRELTIVQVHGKLRNQRSPMSEASNRRTRHVGDYLIRAAYRREILKRALPGYKIRIEFYQPVRGIAAEIDQLHRFQSKRVGMKEARWLDELFASADVTSETEEIASSLNGSVIESHFLGKSVSEARKEIEEMMEGKLRLPDIEPHSGCSNCIYRRSSELGIGCWERHFTNGNIRRPDLHYHELIGHGNERERDGGVLFQEEISVLDRQNSFESILEAGAKKISIQQRRTLQILSAREQKGPLLWAKSGLSDLLNLTKPMHFLDFEASTYAIPMKRGMTPYQPLIYQFSCHTLYESGEINHTEWLDLDPEEKDTHRSLIRNLKRIPRLNEGIIIHYSPFERQALQQLLNEFVKRPDGEEEVNYLSSLLNRNGNKKSTRFLDLSIWIRDYYFNCYMKNGLSLKETLKAVLKYEMHCRKSEAKRDESDHKLSRFENNLDPYSAIQKENSTIQDGSSAMNAWISLKCGLLTGRELLYIPDIMKNYCGLDSLALLHVTEHLLKIGGKIRGTSGEEYIEYNHQ